MSVAELRASSGSLFHMITATTVDISHRICVLRNSIQRHVWKREVAQSCLTLCDLMDCRLPGSSVHGIFQARVLQWVVISFSRGS